MVRLHHSHLCSIYTLGTTISRGSSVQTKTLLYGDIPCDYWKKRTSYSQSQLGVQQSDNGYEVNVSAEYIGISQGDVLVINNQEYKIDDVIQHDRRGQADNFQILISKTTTGDIIA